MLSHNLVFIVYAPIYTRNSAGIYALYKLAKDLNDVGQTAFVTIWGESNFYVKPVFGVPILPNVVALDIIRCQNAVVIYPEVTAGNPLNAQHVMRWIMNKPGCFGVGDLKFNSNEKIFMYGKTFNKYIKDNKIIGELTVPTVDTDLFVYDENIKKTDITIYTGKQKFKEGFIDKYDNLITRTSPSHEEIAKILKRTKILYTFDCVTNIVNEARLCGCEIIYIPNEQQDINIEHNDFGSYGLHEYSNLKDLKYDYANIANKMQFHIKMQNNIYLKQLNYMIKFFQEKQ